MNSIYKHLLNRYRNDKRPFQTGKSPDLEHWHNRAAHNSLRVNGYYFFCRAGLHNPLYPPSLRQSRQ
ncbi:MAG: hypothetical protein SFY80_10200 [Verrucomicrobiota bacterium]|nr:hypothetical protein [Verrucomicrobiota bacterium]